MYLIKIDGMQQTAATEQDAIKMATKLIQNGDANNVRIFKLVKVVAGEMKITVSDPGVLK